MARQQTKPKPLWRACLMSSEHIQTILEKCNGHIQSTGTDCIMPWNANIWFFITLDLLCMLYSVIFRKFSLIADTCKFCLKCLCLRLYPFCNTKWPNHAKNWRALQTWTIEWPEEITKWNEEGRSRRIYLYYNARPYLLSIQTFYFNTFYQPPYWSCISPKLWLNLWHPREKRKTCDYPYMVSLIYVLDTTTYFLLYSY